ncbi:MAG: hypothetical protein UX87_C0008G0003 [Candidatus Amesbacteria bacterium GW2011_GWA1_47_16]|uniref:Peptidase S54 rhomboid domain-containing protein n=4 Tax=Candidatus Amesiibacteriota TaxID=1752730 RepID=A0A0G1UDA0_9BACT|nr:MAG: hypothetical protein UX86_C0013G0025 [Candidatus Amesbacteria bacterium GW2011_GWC1_47_15]KKU64405.1 MAG: hypothetical protein UX87_C0008G0003 [Candidatus Amesbacteria bacterium GW2011_GWA1_47_16]KKU97467.1 MAG: hypothetical protein UY28_C0020G0011 [Candidatus Amesbacteria bacterium GW2011_GWB1_48_13]OGC98112.1 MAG: hypothetical protein A2701_01655 [Candidatus Amesbacteria bacterium RIFCSPHIGHO2_01_FULL_47_34]OGD01865.1 MAG: hypothetical protein A2972_05245 [Candidatus Amesbacteria bact
MIPLRDHNKSNTFPFVTYALMAINIAVYMYMYFFLGERSFDRFIETWAMQPSEIVAGASLVTLITSVFVHGGFLHLAGNMLFLNIFGDNLEDTLGHVKYLIYYLAAGLGASILQIVVDPASRIPNLGASGAIAGLMGGYLILFPKHRVDVLLPVFGWLQEASVPAYTMLFYWFVLQLFSGAGSLGAAGGGIAYFAHVGGFVTGVILIKIFTGITGLRQQWREQY